MLAHIFRFHGHASLGFVHKRGQVVRGAQLSLKYVRNDRRQTYRAAVVVSRKVDKSAVVRNRIRRRIYEVVRHEAGDFSAPYDLVFNVYSPVLASLDTKKLQQLIRTQLKQAGVIPSSK